MKKIIQYALMMFLIVAAGQLSAQVQTQFDPNDKFDITTMSTNQYEAPIIDPALVQEFQASPTYLSQYKQKLESLPYVQQVNVDVANSKVVMTFTSSASNNEIIQLFRIFNRDLKSIL